MAESQENLGGRPTVMTEEVVNKLEDGFLRGLSDREACLYAGISPQTLYNFCNENPGFLERKEELKENIKMRAKLNIAEGILKNERWLSQWFLERRDKDFHPKTGMEIAGPGGGPLQIDTNVKGILDRAYGDKPVSVN